MEIGITRYDEPRLTMPTAAPPSEPASTTEPASTINRWWQRAWHRVLPPTPAVPDQNHQLSQQLAVLETARAELEAGWVQGSWWQETAGRAVDAVYDALWASRGQPAPATQLIPSPQVRLARVRMLTQWNDHPERTRSEVMTVVDRAISATIMSLLATPRQAAHSRQSATPS